MTSPAAEETLSQMLARFESWQIRQRLKRYGGDVGATAASLGVSRNVVYKRARKYGIALSEVRNGNED